MLYPQTWRSKQSVVVVAPIDAKHSHFGVADTEQAVPPTPGFKPIPATIAQLAFPSPDETSSPSDSSNVSHEPFSDLARYDVAAPRQPNKLKKAPPSSYPFSFIPEDPTPEANFPYAFHRYRSTPTASATTVQTLPSRALSMQPPSPSRKLTKRRPSIPESQTAAANLSMTRILEQPQPPPLQRSNTFNFNSLRRKKTSLSKAKSTQSEHGHGSAAVLPALPPPSPLTLNVPTWTRPFHAPRRDSWHIQSASQPAADMRHSSHPAPSDLITEAAWTGEPAALKTVIRARGGWRSTWSLALTHREISPSHAKPKPKFTLTDEEESPPPEEAVLARPPIIRRNAAIGSPKRRWTLAMALTDEGISDELLVEKLEALRSRSRAASVIDCDEEEEDDGANWDGVWAAYEDEDGEDEPPTPPPKDRPFGPEQRTTSLPALASPSTATWQSARRALLTCRELVRTERHYLASLHLLLSKDGTRTRPPALMRAYAGALVTESAGLLRRMEEDPSAWGVAAALLGAEESVEAALVAWCGVVGEWFVDQKSPKRLSKLRSTSLRDDSEGGEFVGGIMAGAEKGKPPTKRRGSMKLLSLTSLPSVLSLSISSEPSSPVSSAYATSRARSKRERDARPAVRDIAILPTQRVMRYVLLYRDLLDHTPVSSPSRPLVARAVDTAMRIAQRCDRAQGNAAFLQQSKQQRR
ncbi:DH domain-containing protein [Favolaschia claudopus]|uniref:DH domain-containing protein n=1 Tax=Favolaschia claudopus TaxID=2862362 RepID=A0AAW0EGB9_9AGAR